MSRRTLVPNNILTATADPATPTIRAGDIYFNTTSAKLRIYTGSAWVDSTADPDALIWMSVGF